MAVLAGVVYLGILSGKDNNFVVWFGIASAIVAPVGLSLLGYAFSRTDSDVFHRLAKIPEIDRLMKEAKTYEEKIQILEGERARLVEVVRFESRRHAAQDRIETLERDAVRILQELDNLQDELCLLDTQIGESPVSQEIQRLRERVRAKEKGDVIFRYGDRVYRIDRDIVKAFPFGIGNILLAYFRIIEALANYLRLRKRKP
jgi:hypothetical protein